MQYSVLSVIGQLHTCINTRYCGICELNFVKTLGHFGEKSKISKKKTRPLAFALLNGFCTFFERWIANLCTNSSLLNILNSSFRHPRFSVLDSRVLKLERRNLRNARIDFRGWSRDNLRRDNMVDSASVFRVVVFKMFFWSLVAIGPESSIDVINSVQFLFLQEAELR